MISLGWVLVCLLADGEPVALDDRFTLERVAREPDIVTPTGVALDPKGRVFVVESHTHFPPKDYAGPKHDRILVFDAGPGVSLPVKPQVYFEGLQATMNIAFTDQGDLLIATRQAIYRIQNAASLAAAKDAERLVWLETKGDYPHNGLSGFAFDHQGTMWIGLGENLGADYVLHGRDGTSARGGGEGGSVYRLGVDGSKLVRIATGFWNPYHLYRSPAGNLFAVDNDPDARPPCRLLHVVDGGDYGFKFRYGRNGLHPFHAWNGELPGTLPMVAGTGEAPSAVVGIEGEGWPASLQGQLVVTSWGDHRIERYYLQPWATSFRSTMTPVVQGGENFRPVGLAVSQQGEMFFSDWVDKSYELHGKGALWRLRLKETVSQNPKRGDASPVAPSAPSDDSPVDIDEARRLLVSLDPFERTRARNLLMSRTTPDESARSFHQASSPVQVEYLLILREQLSRGPSDVLTQALAADDPLVRLVAVQWIGDGQLKMYREQLEEFLRRPQKWTRELLESTLAAMEVLDRSWATADAGSAFIAKLLERPGLDPSIYRFAIRSLPPDHAWWTPARYQEWIRSPDSRVATEVARSFRQVAGKEELGKAALDAALPESVRAEMLLGFAGGLTEEESRPILAQAESNHEEMIRKTVHLLASRQASTGTGSRHESRTLMALLETPGRAEEGDRLFFDPGGPKCYACHQVEGRGGTGGPDLSTVARGANRARLVESILEPSREMAPMFVPWTIVSEDGQVRAGILVREGLKGEQYYLNPLGQEFAVAADEIEERRESKESIMPKGLLDRLSDDEIRNLFAFLETLH